MNIKFKKTKLAVYLEENNPQGLVDYQKLNFTPTRSSEYALGFDLYCCIKETVRIPPQGYEKIGTGICLDMQESRDIIDTFEHTFAVLGAFLFLRSSIKDITLTNNVGVIDPDYQGEITCSLYNYSNEEYVITPGLRIAQLVFIPIHLPRLKEVVEFTNLSKRGEDGFGSTGK